MFVMDWEPGLARRGVELSLRTGTMTMREFLRRRLAAEAEEAKRAMREGRAPEGSRLDAWCVEADGVEWTLNGGPRSFGPSARPWAHHEDSIEGLLRDIEKAFNARGFVALFDGRQIGDLDQLVTVHDDSKATFIRLVPLVGG